MPDLATELAALNTMTGEELRTSWSKLTGIPFPRLSPKMLRLALAWELQARATGGLSRGCQQQLDQLARGLTRTAPTRPGLRLVREWRGVAHVVCVDEAGGVQWQGRGYRSLSEVARAITGTRWSGPAFFGLRTPLRKAAA